MGKGRRPNKELSSITDTHLTTAEAAYKLGITPGCLRIWRFREEKAADFLPYTKIGGQYWYAIADIDAFIAAHTTRTTYIRRTPTTPPPPGTHTTPPA